MKYTVCDAESRNRNIMFGRLCLVVALGLAFLRKLGFLGSKGLLWLIMLGTLSLYYYALSITPC